MENIYSICVFFGLLGRICDLNIIKKISPLKAYHKDNSFCQKLLYTHKNIFLFVFLSGGVNSDGWNTIGEISAVVKTNRVGELS